MAPDERDLDDEIRGHLALAAKERIDAGEDPESARRHALAEFGYIPAARESMRRVWHSRWLDAVAALARDMRIALRSLGRAKALAATIVVTLALGIGANAAIFSVVRGVLLRPLVNRDENRLIYIRQSAPGVGADNLAFSVPEVKDLTARLTTIAAVGEFSTVDFTLVGLGAEPRLVKAGVVGGSFFEVMGLRPVLGRLLNREDDGPNAAGVAVLTYSFWTTALGKDPGVIGRTVRLGPRNATVVGVLEPSVPYPVSTQIIANIVTSPHHLGATMNTNRVHRMTELFGRLAPGVSLDQARSELIAAHAAMMRAHPEAYPARANVQVSVARLRDQIVLPARAVLLVLLAAAAVVFVIACSNVANLILARSVRREGELAIRAALGAGTAALRRTLFAESLVLCGAGAALGILLARPFIGLVSRYAARFSVRALDVAVDPTVLWVGAGLALAAAVVLAFVPRLPSPFVPSGLAIAAGGVRMTPATRRRLRAFATTQVACSFILLAGAGMLLTTLVALRHAQTGFDTRHVLVFDIPTPATGAGMGDAAVLGFYHDAMRRIRQLPGVDDVSVGMSVPWRDAGSLGLGSSFAADGYTPENADDRPRARFRVVAPRFFATVGVPVLEGRDFNDEDRAGTEPVAIVSRSIARLLFREGEALNHHVWWTDSLSASFGLAKPRRVVGVVADVDDENVVGGPAMAIYQPVWQVGVAGRLFVHASGDPYPLIPAITQVIRRISPEQPVEHAATLEDVRAEILAPDRVNAFVFSGFAGIALLIAIVGVAGVLAFSVSARTREFGVRLAVGSAPRHLLAGVLTEGATIAVTGIAAGAAGGYALAGIAARLFEHVETPGALTVLACAAVLIAAAIAASLMPAARAARVDVLQALRSE